MVNAKDDDVPVKPVLLYGPDALGASRHKTPGQHTSKEASIV